MNKDTTALRIIGVDGEGNPIYNEATPDPKADVTNPATQGTTSKKGGIK